MPPKKALQTKSAEPDKTSTSADAATASTADSDLISDVNDKATVAKFVADMKLEPNTTNEVILVKAASVGNTNVVRSLLRLGTKPNAALCPTGNSRTSAISHADRHRHSEIIRVLIANGANTDDAIDLTDLRLLHTAVTRDDIETVRVLLEYGANPDAADKKGVRPLDLANGLDREDMIVLLLKYGASIHAAIKREGKDLISICEAGKQRNPRLAVQFDARINAYKALVQMRLDNPNQSYPSHATNVAIDRLFGKLTTSPSSLLEMTFFAVKNLGDNEVLSGEDIESSILTASLKYRRFVKAQHVPQEQAISETPTDSASTAITPRT